MPKNSPVTHVVPNPMARREALRRANHDGRILRTCPDGRILILNPGVKYSRKWFTNAESV